MKYNVYTTKNPKDWSIMDYVDGENIIVPDIIDNEIDLLYIKEDFSIPFPLKDKIISYEYSIDYDKIKEKLKKNTKKHIKEGQFVFYKQKYKDTPFKVVSIKDDEAKLVYNFKGNRLIEDTVPLMKLTSVPSDFFVYGTVVDEKIYRQTITSNNLIIIDGDYIRRFFGEDFSSYETINLILRLRILYSEYQVAWCGWRNKMIHSVFKNLLDLPIFDKIVMGAFYLTDSIYQPFALFQHTLSFSNEFGFIEYHNYSVLDYIKKKLRENNRKQNSFGLVITEKFITSLTFENYKEKLNKIPDGKRILESIKNQKLLFVETEYGRNSPQQIIRKMEKVGWKWFLENFYFYLDTIFKLQQRGVIYE